MEDLMLDFKMDASKHIDLSKVQRITFEVADDMKGRHISLSEDTILENLHCMLNKGQPTKEFINWKGESVYRILIEYKI